MVLAHYDTVNGEKSKPMYRYISACLLCRPGVRLGLLPVLSHRAFRMQPAIIRGSGEGKSRIGDQAA
eukprot:scaffold471709_cov30-Prasinocladus_malaysianus.AAC.1